MDSENYILVKGGLVFTMNETRDVIDNGAVLIKGNVLETIGKEEEVDKYIYENNIKPEVVDAKNSAVIPGLVCNHTHLFQILFRGLGENLTVSDWVTNMIFPLSMHMGEEESYIAGLLAQMELIRTGSTVFADSHYINVDKRAMDGIAQSVKETGMRGMLVRATQNIKFSPLVPDAFMEDYDLVEKETIRCIETYDGKLNGRLKVVPEAINIMDCDEKMLKLIHDISQTYKTGFHMHTAESVDEIAVVKATKGLRPIEYLYELGLLGPNTLLAHCVWITPREQRLLAETKTKVAHNPVSNLMLGDGIAPIPELLELGVDVGIGVDGAASNNSQDMFEAMKFCLLQHRANWIDASIIKPEDVFEMATIQSAKTLRMEDEIGSLEPGKKADVTICGLDQIQMTPNIKPISALVMAANGFNVDTVIIDGEIVLKDKKFTKIDEELIISKANTKIREMVAKAGLEDLTTSGRFNYI